MVLRHVYMKVQGLSLQMGERKAGRQVRKWNRDGRMAKGLRSLHSDENRTHDHESLSSVQR